MSEHFNLGATVDADYVILRCRWSRAAIVAQVFSQLVSKLSVLANHRVAEDSRFTIIALYMALNRSPAKHSAKLREITNSFNIT